jgi:hypothetical protein
VQGKVYIWVASAVTTMWNLLMFATDLIGRSTLVDDANSFVALLHRFLDQTPRWLPPLCFALLLLASCFGGKLKRLLEMSKDDLQNNTVDSADSTRRMGGDTYNNSGVNYGHMGPINIGRPRFDFTRGIATEILTKVPKHRPINFTIIGSSRSEIIAQNIMRFMSENGYRIGSISRIGVTSSPPANPFSFENDTITIAADI